MSYTAWSGEFFAMSCTAWSSHVWYSGEFFAMSGTAGSSLVAKSSPLYQTCELFDSKELYAVPDIAKNLTI